MNYKEDHTGIIISNLTRSVKWYVNYFGFKEIKRFDKPELEIKGATLQLNSYFLELIEPRIKQNRDNKEEPLEKLLQKVNTSHIALSTDNIQKSYLNLEENKVKMVTKIIENKFFFIKDPDGVLIEIRKNK